MSGTKSKALQLHSWARRCPHTEHTALKVAEAGKCATLQRMSQHPLTHAVFSPPIDPEGGPCDKL